MLFRSEISMWKEPSDKELDAAGVQRIVLSDYNPWDNNHHMHVALNIIGGFQTRNQRSPGAYTYGVSTDDDWYDLYNWFTWPKYGYGRTTKYASKDIQEGKFSRDQAISLVRDYDGEFPGRAFERFIEKTGMTDDQFWRIVESFIGDDENLQSEADKFGTPLKIAAWEKIGPKKWRLKKTLHDQERNLELPLRRPEINY